MICSKKGDERQSVARERGAQAARSQADSAGERWGARVSKTR